MAKKPLLLGGRKGDPHINLCLAVLLESEIGNSLMWRDFEKENRGLNIDPIQIALWVSNWWDLDKLGGK